MDQRRPHGCSGTDAIIRLVGKTAPGLEPKSEIYLDTGWSGFASAVETEVKRESGATDRGLAGP